MGAGNLITLKALFLDLDGVVIQNFVVEGLPKSYSKLEEIIVLDGVRESLLRSHQAGYLNIIFTNQPEVSRGNVAIEALQEIHAYLKSILPIDEILVCPHDDEDRCRCRKPRPGMLEEAEKAFNVDLKSSYVVGDRWRDIAAGQEVCASCFFIDYGYDEPRPTGDFTSVNNLKEAIVKILGVES